MSFDWYKQQDSWVLDTGTFGSTYAIGLSFVFLAYFLHPTVEAAFQRVRAYRGWRAVEKRQTVEVTTYPLWAEIFCGRGRWDAARIVAVLLAAFSLASWGLERQLDLAYVEGYVTDLYLRPPPVWVEDGAWYVSEDSVNVVISFVVSILYLSRPITSTPKLARWRLFLSHFQPNFYPIHSTTAVPISTCGLVGDTRMRRRNFSHTVSREDKIK